MYNTLLHRTFFMVRTAHVSRRLKGVGDFVDSLSPTRRARLKQLMEEELAAIGDHPAVGVPAPHGGDLRDRIALLALASADERLDASSIALKIRAIARWLAAVLHATAHSPAKRMQALHDRSTRLVRKISCQERALNAVAWFHADRRRA